MNISRYISIAFIFTLACTVPKEARLFRKETKEWREAEIVLEGFADTPLRGTFLVLRDNKKFERTTSGLIRAFRAGNWQLSQDTIINLSYLDIENNVVENQQVFIDRDYNNLIFEGEESSLARMYIIVDKLESE